MITISTRWKGMDGKEHWKVSRRIDDKAPYYTSGRFDAIKDARGVADYLLNLWWTDGVRVKKDGKVLFEEMKEIRT